MNDKLTSVNVESFLNDHLERSEIVLLEEGKETNDILAIAEAKGYILKDSNDLAGFKTIYTFDTAANINKARLPKELLLKALPGIIGKPVDIDHNRIYVVGHYIDYRYIAAKHMVIAYGVFYKSNFGEEWAKAKELFKAGKLGTSYEIWCPKSKRKYLPDGTYILTNIEIAGGGLMFKEKPAFPDAKVLELAMKHIDEQKEAEQEYLIPTKKYESCELFFSAGYNYDAKVGNAKTTAVPVSEMLYVADALVGKPVTVNSGRTIGFEKPVEGLPNPTRTQVGLSMPAKNGTPGSLTDLAEKNALKNTGTQPAQLRNDNLADNVSVPGPQVVACACQNCAHNFNLSAQTFQRKNSIDFYECSKVDDMHQCPNCKSIINRQGFMLHPPQIIDFGMSCPSCRSSQWRILSNAPDTADVKCMSCAKNFHLDFHKEETNSPISKFNFLREGNSSCPQCGNNIPFSTISNADVKPLTCRKCGLHYGINLTRQGSSRKIERANEFVQQEENMGIAPTGGTGAETAPQSASVKKSTAPKQKFVPRSNQEITDVMAAQNTDVDNQLTKNLETKPNEPQNEGAVYLVRHGKTKYNSDEKSTPDSKIRGWKNVPLDKDGKQEARELGQIFKGHAPDKLYSSDLSRAYDTAAQISRATNVPVTNKFNLRPWNLGEHQGQPSSKVNPEIMKSAKETPHIKVKGGESFNNFKTRALNQARQLIDEAKKGKKVVAVTHSRVAKLIQAWIANGCPDDNSIDHNEFEKDTVKTGSIHKIVPTDKGVKVTEIADLQNASILDNTTQSSEKGGITMSEQNPEVKQETPVAEVKPEVVATPVAETPKVETPVVEAPKVEAPVAETPKVEETPAAPVVEAEAAVEVESADALEAEEALEVSKTLKAEDRDKLSNDDFAVVKTVKDKTGSKTVRKYPIHDKAHVQNALARLHQAPSRDGLKKLGVDPDAVITKVKAKAKKMGMEDAEIEGYCVASQGTDMQKVDKRGSETNPTEVVAASAEQPVVAKKIKVGSDGVEGLTPDQVNQMQNQLFANVKQAMKFRKAHKASMKNIKALKKAMADGCFASVEDVVMNMDIDGVKKTTVSDVGTGEKPTEAVDSGNAPVPEAKPIMVELNDGDKAKAAADALKPAATGENVEPIVAPASPVANAEVPSKGTETPVSNPDGEKVSGPVGSGSATEVPGLAPVETTKQGSDTDLAKANAEIQALKEKNSLLETAAVKLIERRNTLGEFGKDLSDKDILDDDKFEVAKIKAENKALKHELNTSSAHLAETSNVRGEDETKNLAAKIKAQAQKLY